LIVAGERVVDAFFVFFAANIRNPNAWDKHMFTLFLVLI